MATPLPRRPIFPPRLRPPPLILIHIILPFQPQHQGLHRRLAHRPQSPPHKVPPPRPHVHHPPLHPWHRLLRGLGHQPQHRALLPSGFLDDPGNYCHAGFLSLARSLVKPVAERLRQLLEEEPSRVSSFSLLLTGHSAGGAVAALLYSHMLSTSIDAQSELNALTGCFKRIHCVTFGAPPVSLLPLEKPDSPELRKSLFLSFVNEGDPVVRADKPYVKSLLELLASPPPSTSPPLPPLPSCKDSKDGNKSNSSTSKNTLSNAGRIIVLRSADPSSKPKDHKTVGERLAEGVAAVTCREEHLRGVIWGDPVAHTMSLYAGRIEALAVEAVTAMTGIEAAREAEVKKKLVNKKESKRRLWGLGGH
ncbi:hypothetical protein PT974_04585 [Cladobotryum mycophilum]|uniref:Fungal lipase-type domain-containing protein n=1 Tax=Cladobotryum mycophilum TaxID=491253 RepID=A0ABR0SVM4_9HYPO